jgi:hypothetical protein
MTNQAASKPQAAAINETVETSVMDRELGAAFLGVGLGSFLFGLIVLIAESKAGAGFSAALNIVKPVGALSGKTTLGVIAFVLSWIGFRFVFKNRAIKLSTVFTISIVLLVLGFLMSFPPVFELFAK